MEEGVAKVEDISEEQLEQLRKEADDDFNLQVLEGIDANVMAKA